MKLRTLSFTALAALALTACSSGDDPDSTPGPAGSTPGAAQNAPGDAAPANAPTNVCDALDGMNDIDHDLSAASDELNSLFDDQASWDDPATVAALHDAGQRMLDEIPAVTGYYEAAADAADDPEVAAALRALSDLYGVYWRAMAQSAIDATGGMDYAMGVASALSDEDLSQILTDGSSAAMTLSNYALNNCIN